MTPYISVITPVAYSFSAISRDLVPPFISIYSDRFGVHFVVPPNVGFSLENPKQGFLSKDHDFSRDLQSIIAADYHFNGL